MQDYIKSSLDYIEQNIKADITAEELANMTGYSVTHYYRLFKQVTGLSVANYISKKRINYALFEILSGRKAIDSVLEYGFDTYAGFYKAFVKMYGCPPMKYATYYKNLPPKELEDILMNYNLTEEQKEKIIERLGNGFYLKVLQGYDLYSEKWKLSDFEFAENYSWFVTFYCKSELYGDCVLSIYDDDELVRAYNALLEYNGGRYVRAFGYEPNDHTNGAMLTERIFPGERLKDEPSLEKRLAVFSELWNELQHIQPKKPEIYGYYTDGIETLDYIIDRREARHNKELYPHALKAKEICLEIESVYNKKLLIHGGVHSGSIISCGDGKYKIINPAGVIGDPVFDTGLFIAGECFWYDSGIIDPEKAEIIVNYLEKSLNIPNKILRQCAYITIVKDQCSWSRWHSNYNIDRIKFAQSVMSKGSF